MIPYYDMLKAMWEVYDVIQMMWFLIWYRECTLWYTVDVTVVWYVLCYDIWCDVFIYDKKKTKQEKIKDLLKKEFVNKRV